MDQERFVAFKSGVESMPFNQHIGLELLEASEERFLAKVSVKPELVGRRGQGGMHGGVIATLLDSTCGYHAALVAKRRLDATSPEETAAKLSRIATIDMHVDYIRPLKSDHFVVSTSIIYAGTSIIRVRGEVHDATEEHVASGQLKYAY